MKEKEESFSQTLPFRFEQTYEAIATPGALETVTVMTPPPIVPIATGTAKVP